MSSFSFIDLFCGAGLFSEGFRSVGLTPVAAVDLDPHAVSSYNRNIAKVARCEAVSEKLSLPEADVLIAGPPCQGFSTLGRRDAADDRNKLSLELPLIADATQARIVVVENVPPFLSSDPWYEMTTRFGALGYQIQTMVLDAAMYGTPQLRQRAFTIASKAGPVERPTPSEKLLTIADAFGDIDPRDPLHVWPEPNTLQKRRYALIPPLGDKRDLLRAIPEECPMSWRTLGAQATDVWGRMDLHAPSNTLRCRFQNPSTGRYIHPWEDRVISLREGARIQGIPDIWSFTGHRSSIQRQIGNGVPVRLAAAVASSVLATLDKRSNSYSAAA